MESIKQWIIRHSGLTAWIVLALGMNAILIFEARDVGLLPMQWFWLILITTLVAGLCIWIVTWGDNDDPTSPEPAEPVSTDDKTTA